MIKFPYTDFHEMNLDWILNKVKEIEEESSTAYNTAQESAEIVQNLAIIHCSPSALSWQTSTRWNLTDEYRGILITTGTREGEFAIWEIYCVEGVAGFNRILPASSTTYLPNVQAANDSVGHGVRVYAAPASDTGAVRALIIDIAGTATLYVP